MSKLENVGEDRFNVILIDSNILDSQKGGISSLLKIISPKLEIPIVLLTPIGANKYFEYTKNYNFLRCLSKPYKREDLIGAINEALEHKKLVFSKDDVANIELKNKIKMDRNAKILLVEDNEINRAFFVKTLSLNGLRCDVAKNGEEAIKLYKEKEYDLIFMDCQLPIIDGYDVTKKIRNMEKKEKKVTIIAMTAYSMKGDIKRCFDVGMDNYINKPIKITELERILNKYIKMKE